MSLSGILLSCIFPLYAQNYNFRPPAFPLITHDPYFSIWITEENPTVTETVHWTLKPMPIRSMVRIDGKIYRLIGKAPGFVPPAKSIKSTVLPTQTIFSFLQDGVEINLTFLSPVLVEDIDLVSRPLTYVTWDFVSKDNNNHSVEIYFDISGLATVDTKSQPVVWDQKTLNDLQVLKMGSKDQPILEKAAMT